MLPSPGIIFHPDMTEPIAVAAVGDHGGHPFKGGLQPQTWRPDNLKRITMDGFDLSLVRGRSFEFEFETRGHLIDFNYAMSPSVMRVNGSSEQMWHFQPFAMSFAPIGTALYRRALEPENDRSEHRLIGLSVSPDYVNALVSDVLGGRALSFVEMSKPARWPQMDRIQSGLLALFEAPHLFSRLTAEALANDAILRAILRWSAIGSQFVPTRYVTDNTVVQRAIEFISTNLRAPISLADIATAAGRDTTLLIHAFKMATGRTPYAFLLASRVEAARHDLRSSKLSIQSIATRYCFGSASHFSTTFRKYTGITPSECRLVE